MIWLALFATIGIAVVALFLAVYATIRNTLKGLKVGETAQVRILGVNLTLTKTDEDP